MYQYDKNNLPWKHFQQLAVLRSFSKCSNCSSRFWNELWMPYPLVRSNLKVNDRKHFMKFCKISIIYEPVTAEHAFRSFFKWPIKLQLFSKSLFILEASLGTYLSKTNWSVLSSSKCKVIEGYAPRVSSILIFVKAIIQKRDIKLFMWITTK